MVSPVSSKTPANSHGSSRGINQLLVKVEKFAYSHSWRVLLVSLLLALASIWTTSNFLKFNTSRGDLVSKDLPYNQRNEEYRKEFENFDGMIIVIEGDDQTQMESFTKGLIDELDKQKSAFSQIFYKVETEYFKKMAFLYFILQELRDLAEKIESHQDFLEDVNAAPGLNQLLRSINSKISTGMVETLLSNFLDAEDSKETEEEDDKADLSLLISILRQMTAHLNGDTVFSSPWQSFLTDRKDSLASKGYLVSKDEHMMFVLLNPVSTKNDFTGSKTSIEVIRQLIDGLKPQFPDIQVGLTGGDVIASDEMVVTLDDVTQATQIALVGVALLFVVVFRGVVKPLLAIFSLVIAICWAMGFTTLTVGHLNILSVVFTTILIGLGIDFGVHIIERYREERSSGKDIPTSLEKTIRGTGMGNFSGAITTAIAFGAMTLTDFQGIAELGWIAGGGILLCFAAMIILLPALLTLEEKKRGNVYEKRTFILGQTGALEKFFDNYQLIITLSIVSLVWAGWSLKDLSFDYNILKLQAKGTEAVQYELKIIEGAKRSTWYAAMITSSLDEARQKLKTIKALATVGNAESIVSVLPDQQEEKIQEVKALAPMLDELEVGPEDDVLSLKGLTKTMKRIVFKLRSREKTKSADLTEIEPGSVEEARHWAQKFLQNIRTIDEKTATERMNLYSEKLFIDYREKIDDIKASAHPKPVRIEDIPSSLRKRFVGKTGKYLISVFPNINIWEREAMKDFLGQIRKIDPNVTGNAVHVYESSRLMKEGYIKGGVYAMIAIFIYILLAFKNLRTTFLILLPTFVGAVWTVGIMDWLDVQFNLANLVILPLIIGIGVVGGVHIIHRYREEPNKEICVLSKSTGQAVVISSLTTMIGFGSLLVADHQGIYSLGLVLTIGVGSCLMASVTLLPALLKLCSVKGWKV
ncbi:MAG: MMPL family transporter [Nitrospinota bacterium]|nr:MMPL family transporter [Nitrospinota bacterium]